MLVVGTSRSKAGGQAGRFELCARFNCQYISLNNEMSMDEALKFKGMFTRPFKTPPIF